MKLAKSKEKLNNILSLNFYFLTIIHFFHLCYHPKLIWDVLRNVQKTNVSVLMKLCD